LRVEPDGGIVNPGWRVLESSLIHIAVEVPLRLVLVGERAAEVGERIVGVKLDGPVKVGDGAVVFALATIGDARLLKTLAFLGSSWLA